MNFSSKLLQEAVEAFAKLPGIGKKTALRQVLYLLDQPSDLTEQFTGALTKMKAHIKRCRQCHNIADEEICIICANKQRDHSTICVVESVRDVMAIEETGQFRGMYHILGGVIAPIEGIGPGDLNIDSLVGRINASDVKEIIMAISPTIEGDTTIYYISKKLKDFPVNISTISRGVSFGGELEYADELTLARSIMSRIPYQNKK